RLSSLHLLAAARLDWQSASDCDATQLSICHISPVCSPQLCRLDRLRPLPVSRAKQRQWLCRAALHKVKHLQAGAVAYR
ncbi:MAG: hypothetical protein SGPRY_009477, partial [Prymnesium sp.]